MSVRFSVKRVKHRCRNKKSMVVIEVSLLFLCLMCCLARPVFATTGAAAPHGVEAIIATSTPLAIAFMISMLVLKVTAFVLGYLIVKLGHDTMIRGVSGEIDFGFSGSGFETKLKSASPGAFFILMGAAIIIWGLTVEKPFAIEVPPPQQSVTPAPSPSTVPRPDPADGGLHRAPVPG